MKFEPKVATKDDIPHWIRTILKLYYFNAAHFLLSYAALIGLVGVLYGAYTINSFTLIVTAMPFFALVLSSAGFSATILLTKEINASYRECLRVLVFNNQFLLSIGILTVALLVAVISVKLLEDSGISKLPSPEEVFGEGLVTAVRVVYTIFMAFIYILTAYNHFVHTCDNVIAFIDKSSRYLLIKKAYNRNKKLLAINLISYVVMLIICLVNPIIAMVLFVIHTQVWSVLWYDIMVGLKPPPEKVRSKFYKPAIGGA